MRNFDRKLTFMLADDGGNALDLSTFRVVFSVEKTAEAEPNKAKIQVYNLSASTMSRVTKEDLSRVILQAGYADNFGVIFDGNLMSTSTSKNGADYILDIEAGDGDTAYSYAIVSKTLAAGSTQADVMNTAAASMQEQGTRGTDLKAVDNAAPYPRGRVLFTSARCIAEQTARDNDAQWSIQDGQVTFCKVSGTAEGTAFVLNVGSGMIGSPTVDKDGVQVQCCLNPQLKIYDPLQIESEFVKGTFKILAVTHKGDTHANTWLTEVKCVALDGSTAKAVTL